MYVSQGFSLRNYVLSFGKPAGFIGNCVAAITDFGTGSNI
jgi:hypothetical protein